MRKLRNAFMWLYMLNKRLYKRPSFAVLLVCIAALAAALSVFTANDSYVMKIAVFAKDDKTDAFMRNMAKEKSLIGYEFFDDEETAVAAVTDSGLDAAWIFDYDLESSADVFVTKGKPIVRVVQRDDTIFLRVAREKLYAVIYPYISKALYYNFMSKNYQANDRQELGKLYDDKYIANELVEIRFNDENVKVENLNHMTAPVRGLLAVAVFLCAYSALIMFKTDRKKGMFGRLPYDKHIYAEAASVFAAAVNAAAVSLVSLSITGLSVDIKTEILYMFAYTVMCTAFCMLLGETTDNIGVMSAVMPIMAMVLIVVCPVFVNTAVLEPLKMFLPTNYYLEAFRNGIYILKGLAFSVIAVAFCFAVRRFKMNK